MNEPRHKEYLALLGRIAELQRRKLALEKDQQKLRDRMRRIHAQLVLDIGTAKDEKGKSIYSNEQLRDAALTLKLEQHDEYRESREQNRVLDHDVRGIVIDYNTLVDQKYLLMIELGIPVESENEKYPDVH